MTLEEVAIRVLDAVDATKAEFMIVGAIAAGAYGIPRSTRDFDLLIGVEEKNIIHKIVEELDDFVDFDPQVVFDTITFGKRHVGTSRTTPSYKVELFETFDDAFVKSEFSRKVKLTIPILNRATWLPTAEDVIIQKLRWARPKDLEDARDVLFVQDDKLDMDYIKKWCSEHQSIDRLQTILDELSELED